MQLHHLSNFRVCYFSLFFILILSVQVFSQEDYATWSYSRGIVINTTSTGADISEDVTDFPLLVRLNPDIFDGFAQTLPQGADIRFAKAGGGHLPYEIERWKDGSNNNDTAEIWVKVDIIKKDDNAQYIRMYWGKAGVTSQSNGSTVFDTADGFEGVWHLAEGTGDDVKDATGNAFDGAPSGSGEPVDGEGAIGKGKTFNGNCGFEMDNTADSDMNFSEEASYTLCAWANLDQLPPNGETYYNLINKSDVQYNMLCNEIKKWEITQFTKGKQYEMTGRASSHPVAEIKKWVYVVGVRNGPTEGAIWVDGELSDGTIAKKGESFGRSEQHNVGIGKLTNASDNFRGKIDEARISSVARSDAWIKLSYTTQKPDASCLSFKDITATVPVNAFRFPKNMLKIKYTAEGVRMFVSNTAEVRRVTVVDLQGRTRYAIDNPRGRFWIPYSTLASGVHVVCIQTEGAQLFRQVLCSKVK